MTRWLTLAPLVVLVALAVLFGVYALRHDPHVEPRARVGKPIPDIAVASLDTGQPVRLRTLGGGRPGVG